MSRIKRAKAKKANPFSARNQDYYRYLTEKGYVQASGARKEFKVKPIGIIHSSLKESAGSPLQPRMAEGVKATITIYKKFTRGLKDLKGFERVWLIYWFHRAGAPKLWVVPYMDNKSRGVFATRAPTRPNPIGISCVRLLSIKGSKLYVSDVDCLDDTPLLDIKPYVPKFDSFPVKRWGWLEKSFDKKAKADERFEAKAKTKKEV